MVVPAAHGEEDGLASEAELGTELDHAKGAEEASADLGVWHIGGDEIVRDGVEVLLDNL